LLFPPLAPLARGAHRIKPGMFSKKLSARIGFQYGILKISRFFANVPTQKTTSKFKIVVDLGFDIRLQRKRLGG
jgi:hypothetical protein